MNVFYHMRYHSELLLSYFFDHPMKHALKAFSILKLELYHFTLTLVVNTMVKQVRPVPKVFTSLIKL
jgi:hypothetical protein